MVKGKAVIGANYGDEGKGLMTDFLANKYNNNSVVVRFNGGAQAGHTVVTSDGRRHVFSHFGAGSFAEVPTHLSRFFIVNPLLFVKEYKELSIKEVTPKITIDGEAYLSTPLDMMINQAIETFRGDERHGSCGIGINETVTRCLSGDKFKTQAKDILDPSAVISKFLSIYDSWLRQRLAQLKIPYDNAIEIIPQLGDVRNISLLASRYHSDIKELLNIADITFNAPDYENYIFEGAQGLLLNEDRVDLFPHVTRSKTGLANVLALCRDYGIDDLETTYVTRSYLTRHGAGPLPGESNLCFPDKTNILNQFQGRLRFAPLSYKQLNNSIEIDLSTAGPRPKKFLANMAVTCLDHQDINGELPLPVKYLSYGNTREDVIANVETFAYLKH